MARPVTRLANNPFQHPTYMYPADLGTIGQEPYMIFQIRSSVAVAAPVIGTIATYMPASIKVNYKTIWDAKDDKVKQWTDLYNEVFDAVSHGHYDHLGHSLQHGAANLVGSIFPRLSEDLEAALQRKTKIILNPHISMLFKGVEPRTFTFDFQMFAKNAKESENIRQIIHIFKYAMHPSTQEEAGADPKRYFFYPENFVIGLFSPEDKYLFKISVCVLENMEVDYAGSSIPSFFYENGAPVHIKMSLTFKENEIMTKARIAQGF